MGGRTGPVVLLLVVSALLVLGAWPRAVRPAALDGAAAYARAMLGTIGMRSGVRVFEPSRERIVYVTRNDCIRVRGLRAGAPPVVLEPADGACRLDGFHPGVPRHEWMLRSLLIRGRAPQSQAAIGDFYCARDGADFDEIEVLWTQPWRHIDTGREGHTHLILYRWRCDPPALVYESRSPSDAEVDALPESR